MAPSQLKTLKASLHDKGVIGQQPSKKKKLQNRKDGAASANRAHKAKALQSIREQFNPFEVMPAKKKKYETANDLADEKRPRTEMVRPSLSRGLGEQKRRSTLLVEMSKRGKSGGILDRRFGENNPTMTPEDKALERFVKEKQRLNKKAAAFDLEDGDEDAGLTHLGQSLSFGATEQVEDFAEDLSNLSDSADAPEAGPPQKRRRLSNDDETSGADEEQPEKPKSRQEVMEEVIKKSKLYKYERQQAKEDDDGIREDMDKGLPDLYSLMRATEALRSDGGRASPSIDDHMNPERLAMLQTEGRSQTDREYDLRLHQLAQEQRAKPTTRTLTEKEKLQQEADRLRSLEQSRQKRMEGALESDGSDPDGDADADHEEPKAFDDDKDDDFGLGQGLSNAGIRSTLEVEDEDEFDLLDDLVASGSELEAASMLGASSSGDSERLDEDDDDDDDFIDGLMTRADAGRPELNGTSTQSANDTIPFTYPCPTTHTELLAITEDSSIEQLPLIIQRIRTLYQPKIASGNKEKLARFSTVLVQHIPYLVNALPNPPFAVLESLIRHVHSMAKAFPEDIGRAFRAHLKGMADKHDAPLEAADLIVLTAIGRIFPTSDHFHPIVTPAMLCMTRFLEHAAPTTLADLIKSSYVCSTCVAYQSMSKRYLPEVINCVLNTLLLLLPSITKPKSCTIPRQLSTKYQGTCYNRVEGTTELDVANARVGFSSMQETNHAAETQVLLASQVLRTQVALIDVMANMWNDLSAFCEVFSPIHEMLCQMSDKKHNRILDAALQGKVQSLRDRLYSLLLAALQTRKPLLLHNHRPQAIKTSIPKFEESYNPDRHYDPDRERSELSKLKAEHKKERKGALRELRKDSNFLARESLREKKEKDAAYDKKYKRLVAEIQGEEGHEAKLYEREKKLRKGRK